MEKGQKRKKFHEALMKIFSPPQPVQPRQKGEDQPLVFMQECSDVNSIPDYNEFEKGNLSSGTTESSPPQKLTRAQRKRIRRKKQQEAASCRRKIIGPLLPPSRENLQGEPPDLQKEQACQTDQNTVGGANLFNNETGES